MKYIYLFFFWILLILNIDISAHSGRTDSYGGHNDRKNGGYHYHNAPSKPKYKDEKQNQNDLDNYPYYNEENNRRIY